MQASYFGTILGYVFIKPRCFLEMRNSPKLKDYEDT